MATTTAAPLTLEEFSNLPRDGQQHEITEGKLITLLPAKSLHSLIALAVFKALQSCLTRYHEAEAIPEGGYILSRYPLTIRQPDVSVLSKDRIRATPGDSYFEGAPELAIEIVSPSDSAEDLEVKATQYLQAGGTEVWVLYPKTKDVHVFYATGDAKIFKGTDTLESPVLIGFSVKIADLFVQ